MTICQESLGRSVARSRSRVLAMRSPFTDKTNIAAAEAEIAGIGAVVDVDDGNALVGVLQLQLVGERRREFATFAREWRARADGDFARGVDGAVRNATLALNCGRRATG